MFNDHPRPSILAAGLLAFGVMTGPAALASTDNGVQLLRDNCSNCHTEGPAGKFTRISEQRKTPEGWHMTINRMQTHNDLRLTASAKAQIIQYLADTQGLAPAEAEPWRYLLEQDTNRTEATPEEFAEMCARCHSSARFSLQRRTVDEWRELVHTHIGHTPTLELHAMSRDRPWLDIALNETAVKLGEAYAFESKEWRDWQKATKPELAGNWRLLGTIPGKGDFDARMTVTRNTTGNGFAVRVTGQYADGTPLSGEGTARVYTGYEWRASLDIDGVAMRQVFAASRDGKTMEGRQFTRAEREIGARVQAVREGRGSQVLAVFPASLKAGEEQTVTIVGSNLSGNVSLGRDVRIVKVLSRSADRVTVRARATGDTGLRTVSVGQARGKDLLAVYDNIARVEVQPADAVARIGGPGDAHSAKVRVAYQAVGYANTPQGEIALGTIPVTWSIAPADELAKEEKDDQYAGTIDANGIFTPGDAGPNTERMRSANNVGRVVVVAKPVDASADVSGQGNLLVSVPDFVRRVLD